MQEHSERMFDWTDNRLGPAYDVGEDMRKEVDYSGAQLINIRRKSINK